MEKVGVDSRLIDTIAVRREVLAFARGGVVSVSLLEGPRPKPSKSSSEGAPDGPSASLVVRTGMPDLRLCPRR